MFECVLIAILLALTANDQRRSAQAINTDQPPTTVAVYLNEYAQFTCYVRQSMPLLFWFVNSMPVTALPERYNASSSNEPPADGTGANSTLRILALEETNNSVILCAIDITGRIDRNYFNTSASLLVQGLPSAPINLFVYLNFDSSGIVFRWQPPLDMIISEGISYVVNVNISFENFTNLFQDVTSNLSYIYNYHSHLDESDSVELCDLHQPDQLLLVSIYSMNKVGRGSRVHKEVLLQSLCTAETPGVQTVANEMTLNATRASNCSVDSSELNYLCERNVVPKHSSFLIPVTGSAAVLLVLLLVLSTMVAILKYMRQKGKLKVVSRVNNPIMVERNEAYAWTAKPKLNLAYENRVLKTPRNSAPEKDIVLKVNDAYESTVKETVIYEEILA